MTHTEYGEVALTRHQDGQITIEQADPIIGITIDLLAYHASWRDVAIDEDGNLVIAGQVAYRPIRFAEGGRVIVCEQISE